MSETSKPQPNNNAETVEEQASAWFGRRSFWTWTERDQVELDAWLAEAPAHRIAYWRLTGAWGQTSRLSALRHPLQISSRSHRRMFPLLMSAVAALCLAAVLSAYEWPSFSVAKEQTFATPLGGRKTIELSDGTRIELNTNTTLRTRLGGRERSVELVKGEAFFKVRHDPDRPFTVLASGHRVIDLGTEFLVRNDARRVEVTLVEGRARFESTGAEVQEHSAVLTPGDVVIANAGSMTVSKRTQTILSNSLAWRQGVLEFRYTPLSEAVAELNRYNREKIVVADASIEGRTIYGTVPTNGVQAFIRVARDVLGLHVEERNGEVLIKR